MQYLEIGMQFTIQLIRRLGCHWNLHLTGCQTRRSPGKDVQELHDFAVSVVERINKKYGTEGYQPVVWLERSVPLYERIALYSVADVAVVAATRDGMNLVPYEYIVCRQGQPVSHLACLYWVAPICPCI